jgi:xylose isomerase
MDADAQALKTAHRINSEGKFAKHVASRYGSYDSGFGKEIETGKATFESLEKLVLNQLGEPAPRSGQQEKLENLLNHELFR